jgi:DDB1- and CUL4-associated factor 6
MRDGLGVNSNELMLTHSIAHPYEPLLAVSGIDHTVKIFSPDARARRDATQGIGITRGDPSEFSSLGLRARRRFQSQSRQQQQGPSTTTADTDDRQRSTSGPTMPPTTPSPSPTQYPDGHFPDEEDEEVVAERGLPSMRRMDQSYQITSQNDLDRRRGTSHYISRGMMALMTARFRDQLSNMGVQFVGEDGSEDDCVVM